VPVAQEVPRHQQVERDIAVVVAESVTYHVLEQTIRSAQSAAGLLQSVALFDIYRPSATVEAQSHPGSLAVGEKSMAVRLGFRSDLQTLTDEQVEQALRHIVEHLGKVLGARLRG
jgi:phenylalanyl-tRNA synthetase beta chain